MSFFYFCHMRGTIGISTILLLYCNPVLSYFIQKTFMSFSFMPYERDNWNQYNPLTALLSCFKSLHKKSACEFSIYAV